MPNARRALSTRWPAVLAAVALFGGVSPTLARAGSPPDVIGKKYGAASSALNDAGFRPVVSTTVGDQKPWPECVVTFVQARDASPPPNSTGGATHQALVSLDCEADAASATKPGVSAQSPRGRDVAKAKQSS